MDEDEAMRRLRAADPAAGVTGSWDGPGEVRPTATGRSNRLLAAAAAVVVVAGVAVAAVALHGSRSTPVGLRSSAPTSQPSTAPPSTAAPTPTSDPKAATEQLLADLLAAAPVLPGAAPHDASPVSGADTPFMGTSTASQYQLAHSAYWTAPGTIDDALAYLKDHRPGGLGLGGTGSTGNSRDPRVRAEEIDFSHPDTDFATDVELQLSVVAHNGGVAVRASAQGVWIPLRDPATLLGRVSSVDVTIERAASDPGFPGAPTVHRTLSGAQAQELATLVDGLHENVFGPHGCTRGVGGWKDVLEFTTATGTARATELTTLCTGVNLTPTGGGPQVNLVAGTFDATVLRVLGLPTNYGYR